MPEGGSGALRNKVLIDAKEKLQGKWNSEGPELSGTISSWFLIRSCKENGGAGIRSSWEKILIVLNKKL
jgi:hypothetical protein